jgi:hypothetical protein
VEGSDALKSLEKLRVALRDIDRTNLGTVKRELTNLQTSTSAVAIGMRAMTTTSIGLVAAAGAGALRAHKGGNVTAIGNTYPERWMVA